MKASSDEKVPRFRSKHEFQEVLETSSDETYTHLITPAVPQKERNYCHYNKDNSTKISLESIEI